MDRGAAAGAFVQLRLKPRQPKQPHDEMNPHAEQLIAPQAQPLKRLLQQPVDGRLRLFQRDDGIHQIHAQRGQAHRLKIPLERRQR